MWGFPVVRGPSRDGVPGPTRTLTRAAAGRRSVATKATHRPGWAFFTRRDTVSSAWISSLVARRSCERAFPASTRIVARTLAGSTR